jgi:DNA-binding GntR family transcriptional regulator
MARATDQAYEAIRTAILQGRFAAGERLREEDLADEVGVSRTPIREALRRLDAEGLVDFIPNRGAHVAAWSDSDLNEIFDLRAVLEGFAARLAARRISPVQLARLRDLADRMDALAGAEDVDHDAISELNTDFHGVIVEAAGNHKLEGLLAGLVQIPLVHRTFRRYSHEDLLRSMGHHRELIAALEHGDVNWSGTVMRSHIYAARAVLFNERSAELSPGAEVG